MRIIREHRDRYRTELTNDAVFAATGSCEDLDVLDVGCGEGYMTRDIARRGARQVTGVDRSSALIAAARAASAGQPGIRFNEADAAALPFGEACFDMTVANHVFNDLPDITGPVGELARVLRPGGRLVVLMLHPCFYGHRAERQAIRRSLPVADYFAPRAIEQHFLVDGITSPAPTTTWVRPLEAYTEAITSSGLCITALREPHPTDAQLAGSQWWRENFPRPLFLLMTARKTA
jgi:SAM-dependent methyltransferase